MPRSHHAGRSHNFLFSVEAIPPTPSCSAASFEVNSEPRTGARPSVCLCVGLIMIIFLCCKLYFGDFERPSFTGDDLESILCG
jgi:hypothetical protein